MATATTKWDLKREASRKALLESAMRRFGNAGYAATRVEDIVEGTGYTKGAFYFHFENKLECFREVIAYREALRGDWVSDVVAELPADTTLEDVLRRMFAHFGATEQGIGAWILAMADCFQQHHGDADLAAHFAETYGVWHGNIARFVAECQARDLVGEHHDPDLLAAEAFAYVEGLNAHGRMYGLAPEQLQAALFDGLLAILGRDSKGA